MHLDQSELLRRFEFAKTLAKSGGALTLDYFDKQVSYERKSDNTPVTIADRNAETLMRQQISDQYPNDAILGEEHGETAGTSGFRWILDPIDGTKSFITGVPLYGTLVGLEFDQQSVVGIIELPALDRRVFAATGHGAYSQIGESEPIPARVSDCENLSDAIFLTSEVATFGDRGATDIYSQIQQSCWISRTWGDCYGYYLVATGRAQVMVDPIMSIWDAAALQPIMKESGGIYSNWQGEETIYSKEGIGTSVKLLDQIVAITSKAERL